MVRANGANTNAKIHAPLFIPSAGPKIEVQCTLPSRGRRNGLPAGSWASGGHAGGLVGAARAFPARIPGRRRDAAGADRSSANTGEPRGREGAADGASTIGLAKDHAQRSRVGESRANRNCFFRGDAPRRRCPKRALLPYWASAFSAAISAFMSSSAFEGRHASPRLANSIARPAPWAVCAASCATI